MTERRQSSPWWCFVAATIGLSALLWSGASFAEITTTARSHSHLDIRQVSFPCFRVAAGAHFAPSVDDGLRIDVDLLLGGQLAVYLGQDGGFAIELVPELGYSLHGNGGDDPLSGHYFNAGLGLRFAWRFFGIATTSALLVGKRQDELDLGTRNGLRLDTLFGLIGFEVAHEWRSGDAGDVHGVRIALAFTLSPRAFTQLRRLTGRGVHGRAD